MVKDAKNIGSIFLIGLSGAGKTTLANLLIKKLREQGCPSLLFDGCQMRALNILGDCLGHDLESRKKRLINLTPIVEMVSLQGIIPVVAVIGQPPAVTAHWRKELPNYTEVYLHCDIKECIKRDDKHLYDSAFRHETMDVIGVDLPFVEPKNCEMTFDSAGSSPEELLEKTWDGLLKLDWFRKYMKEQS